VGGECQFFKIYKENNHSKLRFQLYLRVRVNSFAKTIVLEDKNIVPPLWKMEKGIRLLAQLLLPCT
jgi:hypothetical protein